MSATGPITGTSSERSARVHAIRSLLIVLPILTLAVLAGLTAAGSTPIWSAFASASNTAPTSSSELAPTESTAPSTTPRRAPAQRAQTPAPAAPIRVEPAPPGAARLVTGPVERLVDTRNTPSTGAPSTIELPAPGPSVTGQVVSVSLFGSERAGDVTIEGPAGVIEVLSIPGPGATTTNGFVVIPGQGPARLHNPAGGDLVVDLLGRFEVVGPSSSGRLLTVEPVRLAELVTATDGREAEFDLVTGGSTGEAEPSAAVVVVTADVGADGGRIAIGPSGAEPSQISMWGPAVGEDRQRTVVTLVTPGDDGRVTLRYDGGSVLAVDLIAQVTGDGAPESSAGLFLPVTTIDTLATDIPAGTIVVGPAAPVMASVLVGLRADGAGTVAGLPGVGSADDATVALAQTTGTILPVQIGPDGAAIAVTSTVDVQATIQPLGYLLAGTP